MSKDAATVATAATASPAGGIINYGNVQNNAHVHIGHIGPLINNYASSANELMNNQGGSTQIQSESATTDQTKEPTPDPPPDPTFNEENNTVQLPLHMIHSTKSKNDYAHAKHYFEFYRHLDATQRPKEHPTAFSPDTVNAFKNIIQRIHDEVANLGARAFKQLSVDKLNDYVCKNPIDGMKTPPRITDLDNDFQSFLSRVHDACQLNEPLYALRMTYECIHGQALPSSHFVKNTLFEKINTHGEKSDLKFSVVKEHTGGGKRKSSHDIIKVALSRVSACKAWVESVEEKVTGGLSLRTRKRSFKKEVPTCYMIDFKSLGASTVVYIRVPIQKFGHEHSMKTTPSESELVDILVDKDRLGVALRRILALYVQKQIPLENVQEVVKSVYQNGREYEPDQEKKVTPDDKDASKSTEQFHVNHQLDHLERNQSSKMSPNLKECDWTDIEKSTGAIFTEGENNNPTFVSALNNLKNVPSPSADMDISPMGNSSQLSWMSKADNKEPDESEKCGGCNSNEFNNLLKNSEVTDETESTTDNDDDEYDSELDDNDARTHGLRGQGTAYTVDKIVAVRKKYKGLKLEWYICWEEKEPGQYGKDRFTWEPSKNISKKLRDEFNKSWKEPRVGVSVGYFPNYSLTAVHQLF